MWNSSHLSQRFTWAGVASECLQCLRQSRGSDCKLVIILRMKLNMVSFSIVSPSKYLLSSLQMAKKHLLNQKDQLSTVAANLKLIETWESLTQCKKWLQYWEQFIQKHHSVCLRTTSGDCKTANRDLYHVHSLTPWILKAETPLPWDLLSWYQECQEQFKTNQTDWGNSCRIILIFHS